MIVTNRPNKARPKTITSITWQNTAQYNIHFFRNQDYNGKADLVSSVKTRTVNKEKATH